MTQPERAGSPGAQAPSTKEAPGTAQRPPWEELFPRLTPAQQEELLTLARSQGLLYAAQLPATSNGETPRSALQRIFAGEIKELEPVLPAPIEWFDSELEGEQRDAVSQALATPDLCLIAGAAGTGKSRVVAEIVEQAARRGERVLVVSTTAAATDRFLELIEKRDELYPVRCLEKDEAANELPLPSRGVTFGARVAQATTQPLELARRRLAELDPLAESLREFSASQMALRAERDAHRAEIAEKGAAIRLRWKRTQTELAELRPRIQQLGQLTAARQLGQWWKLAWWQVLCSPGTLTRYGSLLERQQQLQSELAAVSGEARQLGQDRFRLEKRYERDLKKLGAEELANRLQVSVHVQWENELRRFEDERRCLAEYAGGLESATASERILGYVNVVCGTLAGWRTDSSCGESANSSQRFDRLVVQEAEHLTPAELLFLSARAARWVLVAGETDLGIAARPGFPALWRALYPEIERLPYAWSREAGRWACRLRRIASEPRGRIEREAVLDCPDIELRIFHVPGAEPVLVEVLFPVAWDLATAKQYIFRELDELAVVPAGMMLRWRADAEQIELHMGASLTGAPQRFALTPGVAEVIGAAAGNGEAVSTVRLEFVRAEGWDLPRAREFVSRHLHLDELGRTVRLWRSWRARRELATIIADCLSHDPVPPSDPAVPPCQNGATPVFEFVSVSRASTGPGNRATHLRGGAGLELDLSDCRQLERLPSELRAELPARGYVNYAEARAVIATLEALARDSGGTPTDHHQVVGVIGLCGPQVQLLRAMVKCSAALKDAPFQLEIGMPENFREREFPLVLVSFTRSHVHRAVPFSDGPSDLGLALTRAKRKLILFGDPGTLARRSQWEGRLEHLNERDASVERMVAAQLVRYLEGSGRHQRYFQIREGSLP